MIYSKIRVISIKDIHQLSVHSLKLKTFLLKNTWSVRIAEKGKKTQYKFLLSGWNSCLLINPSQLSLIYFLYHIDLQKACAGKKPLHQKMCKFERNKLGKGLFWYCSTLSDIVQTHDDGSLLLILLGKDVCTWTVPWVCLCYLCGVSPSMNVKQLA